MNAPDDRYPPPPPQLAPRECFPGVWLVASKVWMSIPLGLKISFSRNMAAVFVDGGWVLLNPVRLNPAAEAELLARGPFRHAIRLGTFHGRDDRYYVEAHGAKFWAVTGDATYGGPPIDHEISEGGELPIPGARAVVFKGAKKPECVILLPSHKLLVTCDSVQHYDKDPMISLLGRIVMKPMGFFVPCVIGPIWMAQVTRRGTSLRADFERILQLDFENLISAHGTPKVGGARDALTRNVELLPR